MNEAARPRDMKGLDIHAIAQSCLAVGVPDIVRLGGSIGQGRGPASWLVPRVMPSHSFQGFDGVGSGMLQGLLQYCEGHSKR